MFLMCTDIGCVGTGKSKLMSLYVLTDVALLQWRVRYVLYVY